MRQLISLLVIIFSIVTCRLNAQDNKDILFINSANFNELWTKNFYTSVSNHLLNNGYKVLSEELEVPMMKSVEQATLKRDALLAKYPNKPRLVIFLGDPAWVVCRELFDSVWKDVPIIVAYGRYRVPASIGVLLSEDSLKESNLIDAKDFQQKYNVTSIIHSFYIEETISAMKAMMPQMTRITVITDNRYISKCANKDVADVVRTKFPELNYSAFCANEISTEGLLDSLSSLDKSVGLIYYSWFTATKSHNKSYLDDNIQKVISSFSKVPVFAIAERKDLINDFAGGYYIQLDYFCNDAIGKIERVLKGTAARDIPIIELKEPGLHLNYTYLQSRGIEPSLYPKSASYINMPPSFFQKNRVVIVIGTFLLLLMVGLVILRLIFLTNKQKQREREIELLTQYRQLVDTMPVMYINMNQLNGDSIVRDVNPAFERFIGFKYNDVVNKNLSDLVSAYPKLSFLNSDNDEIFSLINEAGELRYYDKMSFCSDRRNSVEVFCSDRTNEYLATIELENQNRTLGEMNDKYRLTILATELISWTWDLESEAIRFDIIPTNKDDKGQPVVKMGLAAPNDVHDEDKDRVYNAIHDLISGNTKVFNEEYRHLNYDSLVYEWVRSNIIVGKYDKSGKPTILVGATLNINNQKQLENDLRRAKEQAEEMNSLKSAFIANMSHEIRTPLNAIVGFSELISLAENDEEREEYIKHVLVNNNNLLQLVDDALNLSKIESGMLELDNEQTDIYGIFIEQEQFARLKNRKPDVEVSFNVESGYLMAVLDSRYLIQIVNNLISNGLKFTKSGYVRFGYRLSDDSKWIEFYVEDSGCGIATDSLEDIFGRFVKLDGFAQGTGLGLSICQSLVDKMGGRIWAESELGKGSTFRFVLPHIEP